METTECSSWKAKKEPDGDNLHRSAPEVSEDPHAARLFKRYMSHDTLIIPQTIEWLGVKAKKPNLTEINLL